MFRAPMFQLLSFVAMHRHDQAVMDNHPGFRLSLNYEDHSSKEEMDPQYGSHPLNRIPVVNYVIISPHLIFSIEFLYPG